jgi:hypothetical protein
MCDLIKDKINYNLLNIIRNYLTRSKVEYKKIFSDIITNKQSQEFNDIPSIEFQFFYFQLRKIFGDYEFIETFNLPHRNICAIYFYYNYENKEFIKFRQTYNNLRYHICYYNEFVGLYIHTSNILYEDVKKCKNYEIKKYIQNFKNNKNINKII